STVPNRASPTLTITRKKKPTWRSNAVLRLPRRAAERDPAARPVLRRTAAAVRQPGRAEADAAHFLASGASYGAAVRQPLRAARRPHSARRAQPGGHRRGAPAGRPAPHADRSACAGRSGDHGSVL